MEEDGSGLDTMLVAFDPSLPITALLGAYVAVLLFVLALRVIKLRRGREVSTGTGGLQVLERATRGHANLAEWAPVALILCGIGELQGAPWWLLALTALVFAAGRVAHAYSFTREKEEFRWRARGMHMTLWPLLGFAVMALGSLG